MDATSTAPTQLAADTPASAPVVPAAATPAATPTAESPAPAATPGPVHVEIMADEPVWVLARIDGKYAFSDTLQPDTRRTLDGVTTCCFASAMPAGSPFR